MYMPIHILSWHAFTYMYLQEEVQSVRCVKWEGDVLRWKGRFVRWEDEVERSERELVRCVDVAVMWVGEIVRWEGEVVRREGGRVQAECIVADGKREGVVGREGNGDGECAAVRAAGAVVTGEG